MYSERNIVCVTNRHLCREDFLNRLENIAACHPKGIILREKDMDEKDYKALAEQVLKICGKYSTECILHSFYNSAIELSHKSIHLPLHILKEMPKSKKAFFTRLGCSVHSAEEAAEAEKLGCTYITAGHIFVTDCKKGLEPRGIDFLKNVIKTVNIPVYAIGGINRTNAGDIFKTGAGACIMSGFMTCDDPETFIDEVRK